MENRRGKQEISPGPVLNPEFLAEISLAEENLPEDLFARDLFTRANGYQNGMPGLTDAADEEIFPTNHNSQAGTFSHGGLENILENGSHAGVWLSDQPFAAHLPEQTGNVAMAGDIWPPDDDIAGNRRLAQYLKGVFPLEDLPEELDDGDDNDGDDMDFMSAAPDDEADFAEQFPPASPSLPPPVAGIEFSYAATADLRLAVETLQNTAPEQWPGQHATPAQGLYARPWHARLPRVTRDEIRISAALCGIPQSFLFAAGQARETMFHRFFPGASGQTHIVGAWHAEAPLPLTARFIPGLSGRATAGAEDLSSVWLPLVVMPARAPLSLRMDTEFALCLIRQALDIPDHGPAPAQALSVAERATLEFMMLQALRELAALYGEPILRLDGVSHAAPDWISANVDPGGSACLATRVRLWAGNGIGDIDIFTSAAAARALRLSATPPAGVPETAGFIASRIRQYSRTLPDLPATIMVGETDCAGADLATLATGDIVLIRRPLTAWRDGQFSGQLRARVGESGQLLLEGAAVSVPGRNDFHPPHDDHPHDGNHPHEGSALFQTGLSLAMRFTTTREGTDLYRKQEVSVMRTHHETEENGGRDIYDDHAPDPANDMHEDEAADDTLRDLGQALDGLLLTVRVELGGRRIRLDELARLRQGQLLELGCQATDPVDLVVEGRRIARGELIEYDGHLGVRVMELAA
ncbi:MAG: FliM/FliN family flagellar motor switch protein [Blastocatellia bacterium]